MKSRSVVYLKILGKSIQTFRKAHQLSQTDFSKLSGIKLVQVKRIERGEVNLRFTSLYALAKVMDISLYQLLMKS